MKDGPVEFLIKFFDVLRMNERREVFNEGKLIAIEFYQVLVAYIVLKADAEHFEPVGKHLFLLFAASVAKQRWNGIKQFIVVLQVACYGKTAAHPIAENNKPFLFGCQ